jgi:hypothetical protein
MMITRKVSNFILAVAISHVSSEFTANFERISCLQSRTRITDQMTRNYQATEASKLTSAMKEDEQRTAQHVLRYLERFSTRQSVSARTHPSSSEVSNGLWLWLASSLSLD